MDRDYSMKLEFKEPFTKEEASFLMFSFWYILNIHSSFDDIRLLTHHNSHITCCIICFS